MEERRLLEAFEDLLARASQTADDREAQELFRQAGLLALAFEPPRPTKAGIQGAPESAGLAWT